MNEIIEKIEELENFDFLKTNKPYNQFDGFKIKTNLQEIFLLIKNDQYCCEEWGYIMSEDNIEEFIGSELYTVRIANKALKTYEVLGDFQDEAIFINLETSNGILQFVIYNHHNGYYGHTVIIKSINTSLKTEI